MPMSGLFAIASLLAALALALRELGWIRRKRASAGAGRTWGSMRREALGAPPPDTLREDDAPYGLLVETSLGTTIQTLAAFADGKTSLFSSAGGEPMVCNDPGPDLALAVRGLIEAAGEDIHLLSAVRDCPRPLAGNVRFTAIGAAGWHAAEEDEQALANGWSALSPLYRKSDDVRRRLQEQA